jgi:hypothetical protein
VLVVLFAPLDGRGGKGASPPEEDAENPPAMATFFIFSICSQIVILKSPVVEVKVSISPTTDSMVTTWKHTMHACRAQIGPISVTMARAPPSVGASTSDVISLPVGVLIRIAAGLEENPLALTLLIVSDASTFNAVVCQRPSETLSD